MHRMFRGQANPHRRNSVIIVNPVDLNIKTSHFLSLVFMQHPRTALFDTTRFYHVHDPDTGLDYSCRLTACIYKRHCNPHGKHAGEYRYEVMSDYLLGDGRYGKVVEIIATLNVADVDHVQIKFKPPESARVVKIELFERHHYKDDIQHAYEMMHRAGCLAVKPPTFNRVAGYTTMRRLPGTDLFDLLMKKVGDEYVPRALDTLVCLDLAIAVICAVKSQLHDKGMIHRDIKPENIRIIQSADIITAVMMDYGFVILKTKMADEPVGTKGYIAPELLDGFGRASVKSDVYSLAVTLEDIFLCDDGMPDLLKQRLNELIMEMKHANPIRRCSLDDAINELTLIRNAYLRPQKQTHHRSCVIL